MNSIIEKLFDDYASTAIKPRRVVELEAEVDNNRKWLKQNLCEKQKKFLLRVEDGKDLIKEISKAECFNAGFKMGFGLGMEVDKE